jgi:hypothetical protein
MLSDTSKASFAGGFWFVFHDGGRTIRAWGSTFSGLERIYVDNAIVSEGRNLKREGIHQFSIDGVGYSITFRASSVLKGPLVCRLEKNGLVIKSLSCSYRRNMPMLIAFFVAMVAIVALFDPPIWAFFIAALCCAILCLSIGAHFLIEQD